jgi:hypothetical protein
VEAVCLVVSEIESALIGFIHSNPKVNPQSIDDLNDDGELRAPMSAINTALRLLMTTNDAKLWQRGYVAFQFPVFESAKFPQTVRKTVTIMFSFFIVNSLACLDAWHVCMILSMHFAALNKSRYRELISNLFFQLDYQNSLNGVLNLLLTKDCIDLLDQVYQKGNRGLYCPETCCGICQTKCSERFTLYECGHVFHKRCLERVKVSGCVICSGAQRRTFSSAGDVVVSARSVQRAVRWMEFVLKRKFGTESGAGSGVYFVKDGVSGNERISVGNIGLPGSEREVFI